MAVTLREVAALAGVSRSAVSRTFTPGASVSPETRARVERAATELGYTPNALASSLTTGRTKLIGLIANNFHNPLILEVFDLFTRGLQDRGLRPLLVNLSGATDSDAAVNLLRQYSVDGVIVASSTLPPSLALRFRDAGIPVVHAFGRATDPTPIHVVGIDNVACGRLAARALLDRGYASMGFLGGPQDATSTQDRLAGFRAELATAGLTPTVTFAGAYTYDAGHAAMTALLDGPVPQAFFCADDLIAVGALAAIGQAGRTVPGNIGLIGLNDMEMSGWDNIALTTIRQPVAQIIDAAIDIVARAIDAPDLTPEARLFPCTLVARRTLR